MNIYDIFVIAILAHFVGDYLLQPKWMATSKGLPSILGLIVCALHALLYSWTLGLLLFFAEEWYSSQLLIWVAITHFIVDRYSLGQLWLDAIKGRHMHRDWHEGVDYIADAAAKSDDDGMDLRRLAVPILSTNFAVVVYVIVDNTIHMVLTFIWLVFARRFGLL